MGSDRARVSYDPKQQYRSVVMQQGRVTLEADWNESQQITNEEIRSEALDFVGPSGTRDDGYNIVTTSAPTYPPFDFYVNEGTMYIGGVRAYLIEPVQYSNQPDWQDYGAEDPDWVDLSSLAATPPVNEFIYLYLREQEVSAVEDLDLKDVALGGPDTAQRTRLLQRFVRISSPGADCASGLAAAQTHWQAEGLLFDPDTMRLTSSSMLSVSAADQQQPQGPCQPQAQGGSVDPDNQLIRVQISGVDELTGNPKFLWGFDDASFLYRIDVDPNDPQNLIFQSVPVDNYHQPVRGQAVEVLRTAAELPNGGFVAATSGFVFTLDQNYNADAQSVILSSGVALPSDYLASRQSPSFPLFLRVWQEEKVFTPGTSTVLGDTGLQVTLESNGGLFHTGDYWMFAVRPATPQTVYPERYWNNFQPPDGPRLWACPLGVIAWNGQIGTVASDCRNQFDNLVNLAKRWQGCCRITVSPQDLTGTKTLQSIVDRAASPTVWVAATDPGSAGNNIAIAISNIQAAANPPTFDLTVTETDIYPGLTTSGMATILGSTGGAGDPHGLAFVTGTPNSSSVPYNNQNVTFVGGQGQSSSQANFADNSGNLVFTLQAKKPGADGNQITAVISNVSTSVSPNTFDLRLVWTKTLTGLNMGNFRQQIQANMAYEITIPTIPSIANPTFPVEGITMLSGGADADANANTTATAAEALIFGAPVTICLRPGSYPLTGPLRLYPRHSNLTIEGCGGGVTISALTGNESNFLHGLVQLLGADNITLRGLTFAMPEVAFFESGGLLAGLRRNELEAIGERNFATFFASIGVLVAGCQSLSVEKCRFDFPLLTQAALSYCAGITATEDCSGFNITGNSFQGPANFPLLAATLIGQTSTVIVGYVQPVSLSFETGQQGTPVSDATAIPSTLDNISFRNNTFQNLVYGVSIQAPLGAFKFESNIVSSCLAGFEIFSFSALVGLTQSFSATEDQGTPALLRRLAAAPLVQRAFSVASGYPLPATYQPRRQVVVKAGQATPGIPGSSAGANPPPLELKDFTPLAARMVESMRAIVSVLPPPPPTLTLSANIADNDIDAFVLTDLGVGGFAFLLLQEKQANSRSPSMLTVTGNRLRSYSSGATAYVYLVQGYSAISGNLILNMGAIGTSGQSLEVGLFSETSATAITGNVFRGQPLLPARTPVTSPPLDPWTSYNTQI